MTNDSGATAAHNVITDPTFRDELLQTLREAGELCFVVLFAQDGGGKDWYLVQDESELEAVLRAIRRVGPLGFSDQIEVFGTDEFPHRAADNNPSLREKPVAVLDETGEVVLACRQNGNPELFDVENTDHVGTIDEWFSEDHRGERLVGAHPFRHPRDTRRVFVAYNMNIDGDIRRAPTSRRRASSSGVIRERWRSPSPPRRATSHGREANCAQLLAA